MHLLIFAAAAVLVGANKRGAPCSALLHQSMSPNHGARPQSSTPPYRLAILNDGEHGELIDAEVSFGRTYRVILDHDRDEAVTGFMIRAVYEDPKREDAGTFVEVPKCARLVKWCSVGGNYITHRGAGGCANQPLILKWTAPEEDNGGKRVYFQATVVKDYKTFWVNIITPSFKVAGRVTTAPPTTTKATQPPTLPSDVRTRKVVRTRRTRPPTTPRPTTTNTFPPTTTLIPLTSPKYDPSCGIEDGPDCLPRIRFDSKRKFCEIEGWVDYCPQLCCYKSKGIKSPFDQ